MKDVVERSSFSKGYMRGCSYRATAPGNLLHDRYDLMLVASSWDARCLSITEAGDLRSRVCIFLDFEQRDQRGLRDRHDPLVGEFATEHSEQVEIVECSSGKHRDSWRRIERIVLDLRRTLGRPITVLIDMSSTARYYTLGLMALCLKAGLSSVVSLFYGEGLYPELSSDTRSEIAFTGERWEGVPIPYCEGQYFSVKRRFYLVSVGFEGWKTLRVLSKADPDRVSLLFPDPGSSEKYADRTWEDNKGIIDHYKIPGEQIIRCAAGDAIGAWAALADRKLEQSSEENCFFLCCGTKPHALALTLYALSTSYPAVLYVLPDQHRVVDIQPARVFWRYDIEDVTALV